MEKRGKYNEGLRVQMRQKFPHESRVRIGVINLMMIYIRQLKEGKYAEKITGR